MKRQSGFEHCSIVAQMPLLLSTIVSCPVPSASHAVSVCIRDLQVNWTSSTFHRPSNYTAIDKQQVEGHDFFWNEFLSKPRCALAWLSAKIPSTSILLSLESTSCWKIGIDDRCIRSFCYLSNSRTFLLQTQLLQKCTHAEQCASVSI